MKFFKGNRQPKAIKQSEPRELDVITADYSRLCNEAGQVQYQIHVFKRQLQQLNEQIMVLNNEAAQRNATNKAKEQEEVKDVTNEN